MINRGDETIGEENSADNSLLIRNEISPDHEPVGRFKRSSYYQPYSYGYRYNTGRGYGAGYGYGSRYGYGGYRYGRRPGRVFGGAVLVGGAALAGGVIGSSFGRGK